VTLFIVLPFNIYSLLVLFCFKRHTRWWLWRFT